jgi:small subunit ribosomal protein S6
MRNYELTYILKPDIDSTTKTAAMEKISDMITADGGSVLKTTEWGLRKLGYPIRKFKEGQYIHLLCHLDPAAVKRLDGRLRLNDDVIRHLTVQEEIIRPSKRRAKTVQPSPVVEEIPDADMAVSADDIE